MSKGSVSDGLVYHAGFPNAGEDQHGQMLSIDQLVVQHRASTYFWRLSHEIPQLHWQTGSIVVVDRALPPKAGRLCVVIHEEDYIVARVWQKHFRDLDGNILPPEAQIWGIITYCLQRYE